MFSRPSSFQALLWITCMTFVFGWRVPDAEAQASLDQISPYLLVAVEVDGRMNLVQFSSCYLPCERVMQMDDLDAGKTMIIMLGSHERFLPTGTFVMVDHTKKSIQVLNFADPALADYILSAHQPKSYETFKMAEEPNPLYPACQAGAGAAEWLKQELEPAAAPTSEGEEGGPSKSSCSPTIRVPEMAFKAGASFQRTGAAPKTFTLHDFVLDRAIEVEAEQYAFESNYEMDMLPWLSLMARDQQAAASSGAPPRGGPMPDLKLVIRSEGTSWVASEAPGAADVYQFYAYMAEAILTLSVLFVDDEEHGGMTGISNNMTGIMVGTMAVIAASGMPLETTTKVTIAPNMGPNAPAVLDLTAFLPKNAFPSSSSTSKVVGIGRTHVDFDQELPQWMDLTYTPGLWDTPGKNEYGYEVSHILVPEPRTASP